jgi:hypothetical protein
MRYTHRCVLLQEGPGLAERNMGRVFDRISVCTTISPTLNYPRQCSQIPVLMLENPIVSACLSLQCSRDVL